MTASEIRKMHELKLEAELKVLQEKCSHPKVKKERFVASTICPDCEKHIEFDVP